MSDSLKHQFWAQRADDVPKTPCKTPKRKNWSNESIFRLKNTSTLPRVVWTEESKTGLGIEIGPSYDKVSQQGPNV